MNEEPNAVARVRIDREGPTDRRTTVNYTLLPDTATAGHDFDGRPGTITFEVDETTHYISIPIIDDDVSVLLSALVSFVCCFMQLSTTCLLHASRRKVNYRDQTS